jgi:cell division septation protein DedD
MSENDERDMMDGLEEDGGEEETPHFFCKLTFGQFFTMMVLEVIILCFVFYLGARYGDQYLRISEISESRREPVSIVSSEPVTGLKATDEELGRMAREALASGRTDLKKRVEEILAREEREKMQPASPETAPVEGYGEPPASPPQPPAESYDAGQVTMTEQQQDGVQPLQAEAAPTAASPPPEEVQATPEANIQQAPQTAGVFSIQIGSYPDVKEASYRVEEWKAKGYPAYMQVANLGDKGQWYRVRLGPFSSKDDATGYLNQVSEREGIGDAIVVKNEQ